MRSISIIITLIILNIGCSHKLAVDNKVSDIKKAPSDYLEYLLPKKFFKIDTNFNFYEEQLRWSSSYLRLNDNRTYEFYKIYEIGFKLSLGNYTRYDSVIVFNWDSTSTLNAIKDTNMYLDFMSFGTPRPLMIENIKYRVDKDTLIKVR